MGATRKWQGRAVTGKRTSCREAGVQRSVSYQYSAKGEDSVNEKGCHVNP